MASDLYVYFLTGRKAALVRGVTATPTIVDIDVQSEPYRDGGHRGKSTDGFDVVRLPDGHMFTAASSVGGVNADVTITNPDALITQSVPDWVSHIPPRQTDITVSYWKFVNASGIDRLFLASEVAGWGDEPTR